MGQGIADLYCMNGLLDDHYTSHIILVWGSLRIQFYVVYYRNTLMVPAMIELSISSSLAKLSTEGQTSRN